MKKTIENSIKMAYVLGGEVVPDITFYPKVAVKSCGIGTAPIMGKLKIKYRPDRFLLELEGFESYLAQLAGETLTAEEIGQTVYNKIINDIKPLRLKVVLFGNSINHAKIKVKYENK